MMSKKVLFLIGTQGHLINSMAIMAYFKEKGEQYEYHFINLLKGNTSTTGIENFNFDTTVSIFDISYPEEDTKKKIAPFLAYEYSRVFIYFESYFINAYLASFFKRKGAIVCLANDGNRPYYKINRKAYKSKIFETIKFYKRIFINKLFPIPFYLYNLKYGNLKYIDEYWMPFEMKHDLSHLKNKIILYDLSDYTFLRNLKNSFISKTSIEKFPSKKNIILYTNNILYRSRVYEGEIEILKEIKKTTNLPLVIKMHHATPEFQELAFREIGDYVFKSSIPAEMYLLEITNSIILSGWSASLLLNTPSNKYYWLYNYLLSQNLPIKDLVDFSLPDNHIQHPVALIDIKL